MLTVRTGVALDTNAREIAGDLARAIAAHPLAAVLNGTVLVGTGGAPLITADDARPRVVVPLPGTHALTALAITQIGQCDAVVVRDAMEAGRLAQAIGTAVVVVADDPHGAARAPFLTGADAMQTTAAWDAVDENPDLRGSLSAVGCRRAGRPSDHEALLAEAAVEAVVASSLDTPGAFEAETRG
jgi:hypothetical protein